MQTPLQANGRVSPKAESTKTTEKGEEERGRKKSSVYFKATLLTVLEEDGSQNSCPCAHHSVSSGRPGFMSA